MPPNSLRRNKACELLTAAEVAEVPGLDTHKVYPKYADWRCNWGDNLTYPINGASWVDLYFSSTQPMVAGTDGTAQTVAGRTVFVKTESGKTGNDCEAQIVHILTPQPTGGVAEESVTVAVRITVSPEQQCALATDLASKIIPRLPPTS